MKTDALISAGLLKSGMRRFWPLWLVYLVALALLFVAPLYTYMLGLSTSGSTREAYEVGATWGLGYAECIVFAFAASAVAAVALNERLFDPPCATFHGSLPLRRRTVFASAYLAGFIPLVAVPAVVELLLLALCAAQPLMQPAMACQWFALMVALTFVFYSLAQLACQLSGTRAVAVMLYFVANVLAVCLEGAVEAIVSSLQYGVNGWNFVFDWASPLVGIASHVVVTIPDPTGAIQWPAMAAYCVAGVAFVAAAAFLDGRRDLETAGEPVVHAPVRTVLKYLAGVSLGLFFGAFACIFLWPESFFGRILGTGETVALAVLIAVGAFLGLLFAEMIMRKRSNVLGASWKGGTVLALASVLLVGGCYADALGTAARVPDASEVESVTVEGAEFTSPERIADAIALHRSLIDYAGSQAGGAGSGLPDAWADTTIVDIRYELEDGTAIERSYPVSYETGADGGVDESDEGYAILSRLHDLANSDEGIRSRYPAVFDAGLVSRFTIDIRGEDGQKDLAITLPQAVNGEFARDALAPDFLENHAGDEAALWEWTEDGEGATLPVELTAENADGGIELFLILDAGKTPRTIAWLKERYPDLDPAIWEPL